MKKHLLPLLLAAVSFSAAAQTTAATASTPAPATQPAAASAGYAELMAATITDLNSTGDPARLREIAGRFERAAAVAPADWLPAYYQSYALLLNCFQSKDDGDAKDRTLDQAEAVLDRARKLGGEESELLVVQAYIYQARLGISPMLRSMKYSGMVNETLALAKKRNPANPRIYLVQANNLYYTPQMFGGGSEVAKPIYDEAVVRYAAFRPAGPLMPTWG